MNKYQVEFDLKEDSLSVLLLLPRSSLKSHKNRMGSDTCTKEIIKTLPT
jgi:hypothetical protein